MSSPETKIRELAARRVDEIRSNIPQHRNSTSTEGRRRSAKAAWIAASLILVAGLVAFALAQRPARDTSVSSQESGEQTASADDGASDGETALSAATTTQMPSTSIPLAGGGLNAGPLAPRRAHTVSALGESLVVWGGREVEGGTATNDGAVYDTNADEWRLIADSPLTPRFDHVAVRLGETVLFVGGRSNDGELVDTAGVYDPVSDRWSDVGEVPVAGEYRSLLGVVLSAGTLLLWSPYEGSAALLSQDLTWQEIAPPDLGTDGTVDLVALADGAVAMGSGSEGQAAAAYYDPVSERWSSLGALSFANEDINLGSSPYFSAASDGTSVVVVGLAGSSAPAYQLNGTTSEWNTLGSIPIESCDGFAPALSVGDGLYFANPCDSNGAVLRRGEWTTVNTEGAIRPSAGQTTATVGADLYQWEATSDSPNATLHFEVFRVPQ